MKKLAFMLSFASFAVLPTISRADETTRKAVIELVHVILPPAQYSAMMDQMDSQLLAAMSQRGAPMPADTSSKLKKAVMECVPYDEMVGWTADIYGARFELAEIKDLAAFYKTPTGKKAARLMPELMGEVGQKVGAIVMERMPAALKKYGLDPAAK